MQKHEISAAELQRVEDRIKELNLEKLHLEALLLRAAVSRYAAACDELIEATDRKAHGLDDAIDSAYEIIPKMAGARQITLDTTAACWDAYHELIKHQQSR